MENCWNWNYMIIYKWKYKRNTLLASLWLCIEEFCPFVLTDKCSSFYWCVALNYAYKITKNSGISSNIVGKILSHNITWSPFLRHLISFRAVSDNIWHDGSRTLYLLFKNVTRCAIVVAFLIKKAVRRRPYPFKKEWRSLNNLVQR